MMRQGTRYPRANDSGNAMPQGSYAMTNLDVAAAFYEIADLLELKGEDPFKVRAYRKVASAVELLPEEIEQVVSEGRLGALPGVGKATSEKIEELLRTGEIQYLEELRRVVPPGVRELTRVPGLGAKTAQLLYTRLGIAGLDQLELAAREERLRDLPGLGARKEAQILDSLRKLKAWAGQALLGAVQPMADALVEHIRRLPGVSAADVAGDIRRRRETVEEIAIVVATDAPSAVFDELTRLSVAGEVAERSEQRLVLHTKLQRRVEVFAVPPRGYAQALLQVTGSPAHLAALGLPAWGAPPQPAHAPDSPADAPTEADLYAALGLPFIPPELREGLGEVEAARRYALSQLILREDLLGDLHVHTRASDGKATLHEMVEAARALGHKYLAICDHSQSLTIANGLTPERLRLHGNEIKRLRRTYPNFTLLWGAEVDILKDGRLDYPDDLLAELDIVVASIHSHFGLDAESQTQRLLRAIANPHVDVIAHPTGRVLTRREPYPFDLGRIVDACARTGTALEINASPMRLDLNDLQAREAKRRGVNLVINTDAHSTHELAYLEFGVGQARRAWLEPGDVINALAPAALLAWLAKEKG